MKKALMILCIVFVGFLGLNMLPERAVRADSEYEIGDLSELAQDLGIVPEDNGRYSLASILEAFYTKIDNADKQVSALGSTITEMSKALSDLQVKAHNVRQEAVGVSLDQLNDLGNWTETRLDELWSELNNRNVEYRLQQIENALRNSAGSNSDSLLYDIERRLQQIENNLQSSNNDYRLSRIENEINRLWSRVGY